MRFWVTKKVRDKIVGKCDFFFQIKNDKHICTALSFKISPILTKKNCDPEAHNISEV